MTPLQTDLYQLTMAAAYFANGKADQESVFHLFFRRLPFAGGYAIAAGLDSALDWLASFQFSHNDLAYLEKLKTAQGNPLFDASFLQYLADLQLSLDIEAMPEGTVVFPHEPLLRVRGPILQAQLVETALLNIINFQTLIATKAARICRAAGESPVAEFGYRRAQGPDGALMASRAAYVGGCESTSNVLAGQRYGIPVKGTHAHSWIMSFDNEQEAFDAYARAMPENAILLVDTYDTLAGVDKAIATARKLKERGHRLAGIRLDSGDLAWLSRQARQRLDDAGLPEVKIVASNDLDEHLIESLRHQGARIDIWGVGTNLVTAADQPALGGVYKLAAIRDAQGDWQPRIKLSEQRAKSSIPGRLQVHRIVREGKFLGDAIYDDSEPRPQNLTIVDPDNPLRRRNFPPDCSGTDLLVPVMTKGEVVHREGLDRIRDRTQEQLDQLDETILRLDNPHQYPAGIENGLNDLRETLLANPK